MERVVDWEDRISSYPESTQKLYKEAFAKVKELDERFEDKDKSLKWSVCQDTKKKG